jgi:hypothetical protein
LPWSIAVVLNLGYASILQGVRQIKKKKLKRSLKGGRQRGKILIWGYASAKRLRTPDLT